VIPISATYGGPEAYLRIDTAPFIHALFVAADNLDKTVDEMPQEPCKDARIILSALARAAQLTATQLQAEARERENRLEGVG
jgi:hypothetical protein